MYKRQIDPITDVENLIAFEGKASICLSIVYSSILFSCRCPFITMLLTKINAMIQHTADPCNKIFPGSKLHGISDCETMITVTTLFILHLPQTAQRHVTYLVQSVEQKDLYRHVKVIVDGHMSFSFFGSQFCTQCSEGLYCTVFVPRFTIFGLCSLLFGQFFV